MNKEEFLMFSDYLSDKQDTRLKLFCWKINPAFSLNKGSKEQLLLLISDYERDNSKLRLKNISNFLLGGIKKEKKSKQIVQSPVIESKVDKFLLGDIDPLNKEIIALSMELRTFVHEDRVAKLPEEAQKEVRAKKERLYQLQFQRGDFTSTVKDKDNNELFMIKTYLGNPESPKSVAYNLLNQITPQCTVVCPMDPKILFDMLEKHTGQKIKPWKVVPAIGGNSAPSRTMGTTWKLSAPGYAAFNNLLVQTDKGEVVNNPAYQSVLNQNITIEGK